MSNSDYVNKYISEFKRISRLRSTPKWLKTFGLDFLKAITARTNDGSEKSVGDRYFITTSFAFAFKKMCESIDIVCTKEALLRDYIAEVGNENLAALLSKKRVDFLLKKNDKLLFIEFKTNLSFNDLAAAMVEMAALKKYSHTKKLATCSIHLFPYKSNVAGLLQLNSALFKTQPLDDIFVLFDSDQNLDVKQFERLYQFCMQTLS